MPVVRGTPRDRAVIYCFDIDGTICTNTEGDYDRAQPYGDVIVRINALAQDGHRILLYTARGSTTGIDWRALTERQLQQWGVRYDALVLGKPTADVYVDDKAVNALDWMTENGCTGALETARPPEREP